MFFQRRVRAGHSRIPCARAAAQPQARTSFGLHRRRARATATAILGLTIWLNLAERAEATWSIIIVDTQTREIAIGSATCLTNFDLKEFLPVVIVDVGAAAAQASVDSLGTNRMTIHAQLLLGTAPAEIINILSVQDFSHQVRQYGIVDILGRAATFTGSATNAFANGLTGQTGTLVYSIQGNILTGANVLQDAEQALLTTVGDIPAKLMAAMEAAQAGGGDGRCSCTREFPKLDPTECGSPPGGGFDKAADIGFMIDARSGDADGVCNGDDGCATGNYFMAFNIANQVENDPDPVVQLRTLFDAFRTSLIGHPDGAQSTASLDVTSFPADGTGTATLTFSFRDWQGTPLVLPAETPVSVEHAPRSAGATIIGPVVDDGGGMYHVDLTGTLKGGRDHFHVTALDSIRPVVVIPTPTLLSVCQGNSSCDDGTFCNGAETCDFGTGDCLAGMAPCVVGEICIELDDVCELIVCEVASPAVPERIRDNAGEMVVAKKGRYISFSAGDKGRENAIRVTLLSLPNPDFSPFNGTRMWVGPPQLVSEVSGSAGEEPPTFDAAELQCAPACRTDWHTFGTIDVHDEFVVPDGIYRIDVIDCLCDLADASKYSPFVDLPTARYGDISGQFNAGFWVAADGSVDITTDLTAALLKFRNVATAPRKARVDLEPCALDHKVNIINDIVLEIEAFRNLAYPFAPGQEGCPPSPCG